MLAQLNCDSSRDRSIRKVAFTDHNVGRSKGGRSLAAGENAKRSAFFVEVAWRSPARPCYGSEAPSIDHWKTQRPSWRIDIQLPWIVRVWEIMQRPAGASRLSLNLMMGWLCSQGSGSAKWRMTSNT